LDYEEKEDIKQRERKKQFPIEEFEKEHKPKTETLEEKEKRENQEAHDKALRYRRKVAEVTGQTEEQIRLEAEEAIRKAEEEKAKKLKEEVKEKELGDIWAAESKIKIKKVTILPEVQPKSPVSTPNSRPLVFIKTRAMTAAEAAEKGPQEESFN
jgi:hypothetical protein